jgi:hypothetical protein
MERLMAVTITAETPLAEFSAVTLRCAVTWRGMTFPAGARGVVVHRHHDGEGYEVEFAEPAEAVLSLSRGDLA